MLISITTGRGQERPQLSEDDDEEVSGWDSAQQRQRRGRKQQRKVNGGGGEVETWQERSNPGLTYELSHREQKA